MHSYKMRSDVTETWKVVAQIRSAWVKLPPTHIHWEEHDNDQSIDDIHTIKGTRPTQHFSHTYLVIFCTTTSVRQPISVCVIVTLRGRRDDCLCLI